MDTSFGACAVQMHLPMALPDDLMRFMILIASDSITYDQKALRCVSAVGWRAGVGVGSSSSTMTSAGVEGALCGWTMAACVAGSEGCGCLPWRSLTCRGRVLGRLGDPASCISSSELQPMQQLLLAELHNVAVSRACMLSGISLQCLMLAFDQHMKNWLPQICFRVVSS